MRNVMFVDDATEILWRAAQAPRLVGETFFATGDEHLSVAEIAQQIVRVFGRGRIRHIEWPKERLRTEVEGVRFSSARLQEIIGWKPAHDFEGGLRRVKAILERKEGADDR